MKSLHFSEPGVVIATVVFSLVSLVDTTGTIPKSHPHTWLYRGMHGMETSWVPPEASHTGIGQTLDSVFSLDSMAVAVSP